MDYLGWELERQRAALAALLLGGGEDGERTARGGQRRSPAGPETAGRAAGENAGRYAGAFWEDGGFDITALGAGEAVRAAGRLPERTERTAGAWESGEALARWAAKTGAGVSDKPRRTALEENLSSLSDGTGAQGEAFSEQETAGGLAEAKRTAEGRTSAGEQPAGRGGNAAAPVAEMPEKTAGSGDGILGRNGGVQADSPAGTGSLLRRSGTAFPADGGGSGTAGPYGLAVSLPVWGGGEAASLQAETDARALSRAVQRDARRYDGGFILY